MSCHGFLVAAAGPGGGGGAGGMGGHRPPIPVALIAQRALHAVAGPARRAAAHPRAKEAAPSHARNRLYG